MWYEYMNIVIKVTFVFALAVLPYSFSTVNRRDFNQILSLYYRADTDGEYIGSL